MVPQKLRKNSSECDQATEKQGSPKQHGVLFREAYFPSRLVASKPNIMELQVETLKLYRSSGLAVIPLKYGSKNAPLVRWGSVSFSDDYWLRLMDLASKQPVNLAVVCGGPSGNLTVLDFENMEACEQFLPKWRGLVEETLAVKPSKGIHIYLRSEKPLHSRRYPKLGLDVKGEGGYVLAPPSLHPCDMLYRHVGSTNILRVNGLDEDLNKRVSKLSHGGTDLPVRRSAFKSVENMPPCFSLLKEAIESDGAVEDPHWLRFTYATFLLSAGYSENSIQLEFSKLSGYNEEAATYQISHILRGAYKPPSCRSLNSRGLCSPNTLCLALKRRHPLSYITLFTYSKTTSKEVT